MPKIIMDIYKPKLYSNTRKISSTNWMSFHMYNTTEMLHSSVYYFLTSASCIFNCCCVCCTFHELGPLACSDSD
jgi:hypothetical protein